MDQMFELIIAEQQKQEIQSLISINKKTEKYGLMLTEQEAKELVQCRKDSLKENQRVEFGEGVLPDIIAAFCDSSYIDQNNYTEVLRQLQDLFYLYKNESQDELTDSELIEFMRKQFNGVCFGDLEYLGGTCLERFTRAVRGGYECQAQSRLRDEYTASDTENEYEKWDEEARWDYELYKLSLEDMF